MNTLKLTTKRFREYVELQTQLGVTRDKAEITFLLEGLSDIFDENQRLAQKVKSLEDSFRAFTQSASELESRVTRLEPLQKSEDNTIPSGYEVSLGTPEPEFEIKLTQNVLDGESKGTS